MEGFFKSPHCWSPLAQHPTDPCHHPAWCSCAEWAFTQASSTSQLQQGILVQEALPNNSSWVKVSVCKHSPSSQSWGLAATQGSPSCFPWHVTVTVPTAHSLPHIFFPHISTRVLGTCSKPVQKETSRKQTHKNNKPSGFWPDLLTEVFHYQARTAPVLAERKGRAQESEKAKVRVVWRAKETSPSLLKHLLPLRLAVFKRQKKKSDSFSGEKIIKEKKISHHYVVMQKILQPTLGLLALLNQW